LALIPHENLISMSGANQVQAQTSGAGKSSGTHETTAKLSVKAWWLDGPSLKIARQKEIFDVPPKKKGTSSTWLEFEQNL
jgi:hypothetical protein